MTLIKPAAGYIKDTGTPKGRGVFAARSIKAGETVESCPVLLLDIAKFSMPQCIASRVFAWGDLTGEGLQSGLALGWGSMYNHSNPANMRFVADPVAGLLNFLAARDIEADEELTINYNASHGDITSTQDNWFEGTGIQPM
ncbi:SET domain protein [Hydrogenophaga intermedia]|uniref:SET domain protein n=1 Tax=Hydrogenophaga intermedia TaxID=65786 RepID=A0A1L1PMT3_HYDIT|nr:SET domain-containing protein [Hydrogenophaga intermedia]CDN90114.1 SET domain protein [Hydrogenophaga intermedia]